MTGEPIRGGLVTAVHRVGDTVRRAAERADPVHALLDHLERRGWTGAHRAALESALGA